MPAKNPKKVVNTLYQVSHSLSLPLALVERMAKQGMPVREDGAYDIEIIKAWRDERLGGLPAKREKSSDLDRFRASRADIYAIEQAEDLRLQGVIRREKFTIKDIKDMKLKDAMDLYDQLRRDQKDKFEQEKIERGQGVGNVSIIVQAIKEARKKKRQESEEVIVECQTIG